MENFFLFTDSWSQLLKSIATSLIILAIAVISYLMVKNLVIRLTKHSRRLNRGTEQRVKTIQSLLVNIAFYTIFFVAAVSILAEFGINVTAIIASAGVLGLAIGFGAKDLVSDTVTGFFMLLEDQVQVGEQVTVNQLTGVVEHVGLRILKIRSDNGDLHFILNREIKTLTNHSRGEMLAKVDVPVPEEADLDEFLAFLKKECERLKPKLPTVTDGPTVLGVEQMSATETTIRILARTENGFKADVERQLRTELKKSLSQSHLVEAKNH